MKPTLLLEQKGFQLCELILKLYTILHSPKINRYPYQSFFRVRQRLSLPLSQIREIPSIEVGFCIKAVRAESVRAGFLDHATSTGIVGFAAFAGRWFNIGRFVYYNVDILEKNRGHRGGGQLR
jgi:hypothetical protein